MTNEIRHREGWQKAQASEQLWWNDGRLNNGLQLAAGRDGTVTVISASHYQKPIASVLSKDGAWGRLEVLPWRGVASPAIVALPDGRLVAVWISLTDTEYRQTIRASLSSHGENEWSDPVSLSQAEGMYSAPKVAVSCVGRVVVVWTFTATAPTDFGWEQDEGAAVQSSTLEYGVDQWSSPADVSDARGSHDLTRLVAGERDFALTWRHGTNYGDTCRVSTLAHGASAWRTTLDSQLDGESVAIAADPTGRIIALWNPKAELDAWNPMANNEQVLMLSALEPDGTNWSPAAHSSAGPRVGAYTQLAVTPPGHIFVLNSSHLGIDVVCLTAGRSVWTPSTPLTEVTGHQPVIVANTAGAVVVAWEDRESVLAATSASDWSEAVRVGSLDHPCEGLDLIATGSGLFVLAWLSGDRAHVSINQLIQSRG